MFILIMVTLELLYVKFLGAYVSTMSFRGQEKMLVIPFIIIPLLSRLIQALYAGWNNEYYVRVMRARATRNANRESFLRDVSEFDDEVWVMVQQDFELFS